MLTTTPRPRLMSSSIPTSIPSVNGKFCLKTKRAGALPALGYILSFSWVTPVAQVAPSQTWLGHYQTGQPQFGR